MCSFIVLMFSVLIYNAENDKPLNGKLCTCNLYGHKMSDTAFEHKATLHTTTHRILSVLSVCKVLGVVLLCYIKNTNLISHFI